MDNRDEILGTTERLMLLNILELRITFIFYIMGRDKRLKFPKSSMQIGKFLFCTVFPASFILFGIENELVYIVHIVDNILRKLYN